MNQLGQALPFLILGGLFYWILIISPQRKNKAQQQLIASLKEGDEVLTTSGIYGFVKEVDDEAVWLEVAEGMELRLVPAAVQSKIAGSDQDDKDDKAEAASDSTEKDD